MHGSMPLPAAVNKKSRLPSPFKVLGRDQNRPLVLPQISSVRRRVLVWLLWLLGNLRSRTVFVGSSLSKVLSSFPTDDMSTF